MGKQKLVLISSKHLSISLDQVLQNFLLIGYDKSSWGGQIIWQWIKDMKLDHHLRCEVDSLETIAILVEQNLGVAIVPEWDGLKQRHPSLFISPLDTVNLDKASKNIECHGKFQTVKLFLSVENCQFHNALSRLSLTRQVQITVKNETILNSNSQHIEL